MRFSDDGGVRTQGAGMHPGEIKSALARAGVTQRQVALELDVKENVVSAIVNRRGRSARIEQRISEITDIPLYYLWPDRYEVPKDAPQGFDPTRLNVDLLESVERTLEQTLISRVPGLKLPFLIKARHRVAVYNACLDRGTAAIETGAGVAAEVNNYLERWAVNYEQTTGGDTPTPEALSKWALRQV